MATLQIHPEAFVLGANELNRIFCACLLSFKMVLIKVIASDRRHITL